MVVLFLFLFLFWCHLTPQPRSRSGGNEKLSGCRDSLVTAWNLPTTEIVTWTYVV